jgi:hypothetical protein
MITGEIGIIIKDDKSPVRPFKVRAKSGKDWWYDRGALALATRQSDSRDCEREVNGHGNEGKRNPDSTDSVLSAEGKKWRETWYEKERKWLLTFT